MSAMLSTTRARSCRSFWRVVSDCSIYFFIMSSFSYLEAFSTCFSCSSLSSSASSDSAARKASEASLTEHSCALSFSSSAAQPFSSSSISRSLPSRLNSDLCTLPPVIEPPGLIMSPFSVAILNDEPTCLLMAMPVSRSSTITVLPSKFEHISAYRGAHSTSSAAMPWHPRIFMKRFSASVSALGRMADTGRSVARP